jgi:molybdopterin-containing oxidoreductase family molybdopterin binding subunit
LYSNSGASALLAGFGVDRYDNAHLTGRGFGTLAALTHNVGKPGASVGSFFGGGASVALGGQAYKWNAPSGTYAPSLNLLQCYDAITTGKVTRYSRKDPKNPLVGTKTKDPESVDYVLKAAVIADANFVSNLPAQKRIIDDVFSESNLEFVVVHDQFMTDTMAYADIALPATSWFENDDILMALHPNLMMQNRAIEPLYEAKSNWDLFQLLAQKMGFDQYFKGSAKDFRDSLLTTMESAFGKAKIDEFRANGVVRLSAYPAIPFQDSKFPTESGRAEFYAERVIVNSPYSYPALGIPVTFGLNPLPHYEPPREVAADNPLAKKYPLTFFQKHALWRVHTQWFNVPWIRELDPYPHVDMTPGDASARSIAEGDVVDVYNDRGSVTLKAHLTEALPDGAVNIDKGWQRNQFVAGGYQELTSSYVNPITTNCSYYDARVEVKKHGGA